jgi:hypothetical protein
LYLFVPVVSLYKKVNISWIGWMGVLWTHLPNYWINNLKSQETSLHFPSNRNWERVLQMF